MSEEYEPGDELTNEDRTMGMLCHLTTFCGFIGIPFGNIIVPLVIWLVKKDQSPFVDYHGKEALNFQITMTIYALISAVLCLILIGFLLMLVIIIADIVLTIVATVKANNGEYYRYPMTFRLIN